MFNPQGASARITVRAIDHPMPWVNMQETSLQLVKPPLPIQQIHSAKLSRTV
jgi:hypothetical protein